MTSGSEVITFSGRKICKVYRPGVVTCQQQKVEVPGWNVAWEGASSIMLPAGVSRRADTLKACVTDGSVVIRSTSGEVVV